MIKKYLWHGWRTDKGPEDITTVQELLRMYELQEERRRKQKQIQREQRKKQREQRKKQQEQKAVV